MKKENSVNTEYSTSEFINSLFGWTHFADGYLELVLDLNKSHYFGPEKVAQAIQFARDASENGHQVFFGPALREHDLGNKRSDNTNLLGSRCLWVDIDPPDKSLPAEVQ